MPEFAVYVLTLTEDAKAKTNLQKYLEEWRHVKPKTTGHDLKGLGLPPGPQYQNILRQLRNAWLDGGLKSPEDEDAMLKQLLPKA